MDVALITLVLPSANNRAKDLGSINIAKTLPQSLGPVIAALVMSAFHSYTLLFIIGGDRSACIASSFFPNSSKPSAPGECLLRLDI